MRFGRLRSFALLAKDSVRNEVNRLEIAPSLVFILGPTGRIPLHFLIHLYSL